MSAIIEQLYKTPSCSDAEWNARVAQAAVIRLMDRYGMTDLANQVVGARVPDVPDQYMLHQYGLLWDEITASSLIKTDSEGRAVDPDAPMPVDGAQNLAKWIFGTRPDINFFIHGHCEDIMAVSATQQGLVPVAQAAVYLLHLVDYIDYDFSEGDEYAEKFIKLAASKDILITRNHGYYVFGKSASEAFFRAYYLRQACSTQVKTFAMDPDPRVMDPQKVAQFQDEMYASEHYNYDGSTEWAALLRKLDREQPDYKQEAISPIIL